LRIESSCIRVSNMLKQLIAIELNQAGIVVSLRENPSDQLAKIEELISEAGLDELQYEE